VEQERRVHQCPALQESTRENLGELPFRALGRVLNPAMKLLFSVP
jgi:hypothetical protein